MSPGRLTIEERKQVLKWYWKFENIAEVQREWGRHFGTSPPTRITIARLREKFETDGTVQDVCQRYSGRPPTGVGLIEDHAHNVSVTVVPSPEKARHVSSEKPLFVSTEKSQYVSSEKPQYLSSEKPQFVSSEKPQFVSSEKPHYVSSEKSHYVSSEKPQYVSSEKPQYVSSEKPQYVSSEKLQYMPAAKSQYGPPEKSQYIHSSEKAQSPLQYRPTYDLSLVTRENAVQLLLKAANK